MGCYGQTHFLHGVEGWLLGDQPVHEPCQCFFRENGLTQRRSSTGIRKAIGFESSEENNKWEMPFGVGRQNDRRSDRKAERRQLSCMAQVATTGR